MARRTASPASSNGTSSFDMQELKRRREWTPKRAGMKGGRRVLNVSVAFAVLAIAAPLMILIGLLIKLTSRGPALFTQPRVGIDQRNGNRNRKRGRDTKELRECDWGGRIFHIYKFRTMSDGADSEGQVWASPDDPRVTPIGRILRSTRLDELPQLLNVLKGEMNVVGPRPEQPEICAKLRDEIKEYPMRQRVLPGITGWAQVNHSYDRSVDDVRRKVAFDLEYIERSSAFKDLEIMIRTPPVMLFRNGGW